MPGAYDHRQLRLEVLGPVAAESPFDSGTLWGRILCSLKSGPQPEQDLADVWLSELGQEAVDPSPDFLPPLIISEGLQCDAQGEPWLALPLSFALKLQFEAAEKESVPRKQLKRLDCVPMKTFVRICQGDPVLAAELVEVYEGSPRVAPALQPHLGMDRLSGSGRDGALYATAVTVYSAGSKAAAEIVFYIKVRPQSGMPELVHSALERLCVQGWGHGKTRGLGRIRLKSFLACDPPPPGRGARGFVSLSHFSPAKSDPTEGQWRLHAKHPVPAQFVDGKRVALGEEGQWRIKSFLRLRAGSCLFFEEGATMREYYGRTLSGLLDPAEDHLGNPLPTMFQYALAYPWPLKKSE